MNDLSSVLYLIFLAGVVLFAFVLTPKLDRDRIRENVESHGGKVIEISRVWEWARHYDRCYEVSYLTARGKSINATCRTNMWRGVYWVNDRPPGLFSDQNKGDDLSMDYREFSRAAEPIQCLGCGATIPANKTSCPHCGWSYSAHHAGN